MSTYLKGQSYSAACANTHRDLDEAYHTGDTLAVTGATFHHLLAAVHASKQDAPEIWEQRDMIEKFTAADIKLAAKIDAHTTRRPMESVSAVYGALFLHQLCKILDSANALDHRPQTQENGEALAARQDPRSSNLLERGLINAPRTVPLETRIQGFQNLIDSMSERMRLNDSWDKGMTKSGNGVYLFRGNATGDPDRGLGIPLYNDEIKAMEQVTILTSECPSCLREWRAVG